MAITGTASAKKCVRGPDKQPRRKKTQIEREREGNIVAETVAETKKTAAV